MVYSPFRQRVAAATLTWALRKVWTVTTGSMGGRALLATSWLIVQLPWISKGKTSVDALELLKEIDQKLGVLLSRFSEVASQIQLQPVCNLSEEAALAHLNYPGIYLVEIRNTGQHASIGDWMKWFTDKWDDKAYVGRFTPTTKLKRIAQHSKLTEWVPIYLGKSKRVGSRVREHMDLALEKRTFAMKLKARGGFFSENTFRLSTAKVDVAHYDLLVPMVEHTLRKKLSPIVGKQ
jgi:hypothetical protein